MEFSPILVSCITLIVLVAGLSASIPFIKRFEHQKLRMPTLADALAAGTFLGAGLLHMLAESIHEFADRGHGAVMPIAMMTGTFLLLLFIGQQRKTVFLTLFILCWHAFFEGVALGLSDTVNLLLALTVAIIAHKWAISFTLAEQFALTTRKLWHGIAWVLLFIFMLPLGTLTVLALQQDLLTGSLAGASLDAIAAGIFIYLAVEHIIKRQGMRDKHGIYVYYSFIMIGFFITVLVTNII